MWCHQVIESLFKPRADWCFINQSFAYPKNKFMQRFIIPVIWFYCLIASVVCVAQGAAGPGLTNTDLTDELLVEYPASFFRRYQPATALDMLRQLPGFQIDDGTSDRGFIAAVGNILINDVYPSVKQDTPSALLARIAANQVARIELIRGQVRGIDLQGQSQVANVILRADLPPVVRWDAYVRQHSDGPLKPGVDTSLSHRWNEIDYNVGVRIEREANGETGTDSFIGGNGTPFEESSVEQIATGIDLTATINASSLIGQTLTQFNTRTHYETRDRREDSEFSPFLTGGVPRHEFVGNDMTIKQFEIGADALRNLSTSLVGKAIFQFFLDSTPRITSRILTDEDGVQTLARVADITDVATETIARIELDWTGIEDHNIQFNIEGAYNSVDGTLEQTIDRGMGAVLVDIPGSNSLVEELRADFLIKDTWGTGQLELDYGLGAEVSNISQTGDFEQERNFFFIKPHTILTYSSGDGGQTKARVAREIAQLDFDDFISTTVFEDNELSLGNPNLRPDATWVAELSHERRFGQESVIKVIAFHHWISNVLDLLPLSDTDEAPGNIGSGRRWGVELEGTIPLEWLGLSGAKFDLSLLWQDSTVIDPVTGQSRVLSGQGGVNAYRSLLGGNNNIRYLVRLKFRQDLEAAKVAWGWSVAERDHRQLFKVNEFDVHNEGFAIDAFIETTRWQGFKVSIVGDNLLRFKQNRYRTFYTGLRGLSAVESQEFRTRFNGRRITLTVSGNF